MIRLIKRVKPELLLDQILERSEYRGKITTLYYNPNTQELTIEVPEDVEEADILDLIDTHDPDELSIVEKQRDLAESIKPRVHNIPGWATWTEQEALDWFNANISDTQIDAVTNLTEAKVILKHQSQALFAIGRMVMALRDHTWPELAIMDREQGS